MCETIAWVFERTGGPALTPGEIWRIDRRGELWPVYHAFDVCCEWIATEFGGTFTPYFGERIA